MDRPSIENAPGLIWRERKNGWSAVWLARTDLIKRGYLPKSLTGWKDEYKGNQRAASYQNGRSAPRGARRGEG